MRGTATAIDLHARSIQKSNIENTPDILINVMNQNSHSKITAIIPAYNEATRISQVITDVSSFVDQILVIDDASTDETAHIAKMHGATVISMNNNSGYIAAIKTGILKATNEIVITLDADGEHSPKNIPDLVQPIILGTADMVQGHRNRIIRPSERLINWLAQRRFNVGDSGTGMRAIRTELAKRLELKGACICGIIALEVASNGGRIVDIPITLNSVHKPRKIAWYHFRQFFYLLQWLIRNR
jgi:glycosyltransferase involved in cell wall biosynthesis